jgi:hypothetical protein
MTKVRPIIFGAESVRRILSGQKTQTRRVIRETLYHFAGAEYPWQIQRRNGEWCCWKAMDQLIAWHCPYGIGDRLWVKETWMPVDVTFRVPARFEWRIDLTGQRHAVVYRADVDYHCSWRSPLHMPRWASRLLLEITEVRVERLQESNDADIVAEGFNSRHHFVEAWDQLNAKRGYPYASNCWVWALTFKMV